MPEWAEWFGSELNTHKAVIRVLGIGCAPVLIKGEKEQFLDWLSWGVESGAVKLPTETGSVRWPSLSLEDIFLPTSKVPKCGRRTGTSQLPDGRPTASGEPVQGL